MTEQQNEAWCQKYSHIFHVLGPTCVFVSVPWERTQHASLSYTGCVLTRNFGILPVKISICWGKKISNLSDASAVIIHRNSTFYLKMCATENTPLVFPIACSLCWKSRVHWWAEESAFCGLPSKSPVCPSPGNRRRWRSAGVQAHRQQHAGTCRRTTVIPSPQSSNQDRDGITVGHFLSMD